MNPVNCGVSGNPDLIAATVLFAGLAPGMIGIYQLDVLLPRNLPAGSTAQVVCHVSSNDVGISFPIRQ